VGTWWRGLGGLALIAVLASCSTAPGNAETDRVATVVATAISQKRLDSMDGYVRAALATRAGRDSRLTVVEADELHADQLVDPLARLVFQVHLDDTGTSTFGREPITACYEAKFSYYGVIGNPHRVDCTVGATAIVPVPLPPQPHVVIPEGFDSTLADLLAALPASPSAGDVTASVIGGLPAPGFDPTTGLRDLPPTVDAAVTGTDVGVSLWDPDDRICLLGARLDGQVTVWRPSGVQMQPGELSCDPQTALQRLGVIQPH